MGSQDFESFTDMRHFLASDNVTAEQIELACRLSGFPIDEIYALRKNLICGFTIGFVGMRLHEFKWFRADVNVELADRQPTAEEAKLIEEVDALYASAKVSFEAADETLDGHEAEALLGGALKDLNDAVSAMRKFYHWDYSLW
jgi:hypothetical protein